MPAAPGPAGRGARGGGVGRDVVRADEERAQSLEDGPDRGERVGAPGEQRLLAAGVRQRGEPPRADAVDHPEAAGVPEVEEDLQFAQLPRQHLVLRGARDGGEEVDVAGAGQPVAAGDQGVGDREQRAGLARGEDVGHRTIRPRRSGAG